MSYPQSPGYAKNSDTSKAAAHALTGHGAVSSAVLRAIRDAGNHGMIVDEAKIIIERVFERDFDRSTVAARFTELKEGGMIEETNATRPTPRGRQATVFKITIKGRDFVLNN